MSYVIFLPQMSWTVADMAYQFTYSDYSADEVKRSGNFCEEGDELSYMILNVPKRPRVDGFLGLFLNGTPEQIRFSFKVPFRGSVLRNDRPFGSDSWWFGEKQRPAPDNSKRGVRDSGYRIAILIDRQVEYRGIGLYSDLLFWMRRDAQSLEMIAKKSSGYYDAWQEHLEKEIEYLSHHICPLVTYDAYKDQQY